MQRTLLKPPFLFRSFLLCLLFLQGVAYAGGRWFPGFIVTANGDTLRGSLTFHHSRKSPVSVSFRPATGGERSKYKAHDIRMFSTHEEDQDVIYVTLTTEIDVSEISLEHLAVSSLPKMEQRTFFAQLLIEGTKSLFEYVDNNDNKTHFVVKDETGKLTELVNNRYYTGNDRTYAVYSETYKKQLGQLLADCKLPGAQRISSTSFSQKRIADLLNEYNKCVRPNSANGYTYRPEKSLADLGALAGSGIVHIYLNDPALALYKFKPAAEFYGGVFANLYYSRTRKSWSFYNELMACHYGTTAPDFIYKMYYTTTTVTGASIKETAVKLVDMISYQYPDLKYLQPFIRAGIANSFALKMSATSKESGYYAANAVAPLFDYGKYQLLKCAGIGATYKHYGAEVRYEQGNGLSPTSPIKTTFIDVLLNYKF